jgi:tetratricopeptide (TPR) repeat protein
LREWNDWIDSVWNFDDPAESEARFATIIDLARTQQARALGLQRRFDAGHELLDQIEAQDSIVLARCALERGRLYRSSGDPAASIPLFQLAIEHAKASGDDALTIDALHMLAIVSSADQGLQWNGDAIALAESSDQSRAKRWLGSLLNNMGWTLHDLGRFEEALSHFQRAEQFFAHEPQGSKHRIARWTVGRCLRSLQRHQEALAIHDQLMADGHEEGYLFEEIGENALALGQKERAVESFHRAYQLLKSDDWFARHESDRLERLRKLGQP